MASSSLSTEQRGEANAITAAASSVRAAPDRFAAQGARWGRWEYGALLASAGASAVMLFNATCFRPMMFRPWNHLLVAAACGVAGHRLGRLCEDTLPWLRRERDAYARLPSWVRARMAAEADEDSETTIPDGVDLAKDVHRLRRAVLLEDMKEFKRHQAAHARAVAAGKATADDFMSPRLPGSLPRVTASMLQQFVEQLAEEDGVEGDVAESAKVQEFYRRLRDVATVALRVDPNAPSESEAALLDAQELFFAGTTSSTKESKIAGRMDLLELDEETQLRPAGTLAADFAQRFYEQLKAAFENPGSSTEANLKALTRILAHLEDDQRKEEEVGRYDRVWLAFLVTLRHAFAAAAEQSCYDARARLQQELRVSFLPTDDKHGLFMPLRDLDVAARRLFGRHANNALIAAVMADCGWEYQQAVRAQQADATTR